MTNEELVVLRDLLDKALREIRDQVHIPGYATLGITQIKTYQDSMGVEFSYLNQNNTVSTVIVKNKK